MLYEVITILDINSYGAYVDMDESFPTGQNIYLSFFNPFSERHMDLGGKIIWSSIDGIGVSFNDLSKARYIWCVITSYSIHYTKLYDA